MTDEAFQRYMLRDQPATVIEREQPTVSFAIPYGLLIEDPEQGSQPTFLIGNANPIREARELARRLLMCADELERRGYES